MRIELSVSNAGEGIPRDFIASLIRRVRARTAHWRHSRRRVDRFRRTEDRQLALQAGFQLHLTKPIDAQTLVSAVASLGGRNVELARAT